MIEFTEIFFTTTTAEDEQNYFSGKSYSTMVPSGATGNPIEPGLYRIVDGSLLPIISGLPAEETRKFLVRFMEVI